MRKLWSIAMRDTTSQDMAGQPVSLGDGVGRTSADAATPVFAVVDYIRRLTQAKITQLFVGIVMSLVVAELAVGWLNPQEEVLKKDLVVPDSALDFRMVPNYRGTMTKKAVPLSTSSLGLRDREYGPRANGTLRLYALGDSMVFGNGVPIANTFGAVMG